MARQLASEDGVDVAIVGVPSMDSTEAMQDFVDRHGLGEVPHAVDLDRVVWSRNGIPAQPAWVFVAPDGDTATVLGALDTEQLADRLRALGG